MQSPTKPNSNNGQTQSRMVFFPTLLPAKTAAIWQNQVKTLNPAEMPVWVVGLVIPTWSKMMVSARLSGGTQMEVLDIQ